MDFKSYIQGNDFGVDMFAAFTNLLRSLEGCAYDVDNDLKTIHYMDHQWGGGGALSQY